MSGSPLFTMLVDECLVHHCSPCWWMNVIHQHPIVHQKKTNPFHLSLYIYIYVCVQISMYIYDRSTHRAKKIGQAPPPTPPKAPGDLAGRLGCDADVSKTIGKTIGKARETWKIIGNSAGSIGYDVICVCFYSSPYC